MFGIFRYFLAWCVVYVHLWEKVGYIGVYAVYSFFLLSGYLMARVLNDRYGFDFNGLTRFSVNRFLRIYPPYYFFLILSLIIIYIQPDISWRISSYMIFPDLKELIYNLSIIKVTSVQPQLIPTAWSLRIELVYYVLLALIITRKRSICFFFLICSILYNIYLLVEGYPLVGQYFTLYASSLPFCLGASAYFIRNELRFIKFTHAKYIAVLFVFNLFFSEFWGDPYKFGYFVSIFMGFLLILALSRSGLDRNSFFMKADKLFGDLSYPVFLCHYFIFCLIVSFGLADSMGARVFFISVIPINLLSYISCKYVEQPINNVRSRIRPTRPK